LAAGVVLAVVVPLTVFGSSGSGTRELVHVVIKGGGGLVDTGGYEAIGNSNTECQGSGKYDEAIKGAALTLANDGGRVVATGRLGSGYLGGSADFPANTPADVVECVFDVNVTIPNGHGDIGFSVADLPTVEISKDELELNGWGR
jgi:hypothetical protein